MEVNWGKTKVMVMQGDDGDREAVNIGDESGRGAEFPISGKDFQ